MIKENLEISFIFSPWLKKILEFDILKSLRLTENYCSIIHHNWREPWKFDHLKLSMLSEIYFSLLHYGLRKKNRFNIVSCLVWQKLSVYFFVSSVKRFLRCWTLTRGNLKKKIYFFTMVEEIFQNWPPEIPQIVRNLLYNSSPLLKNIFKISSFETAHISQNLLYIA